MDPVTYHRSVVGIGVLSGVIGGILSSYMCIFSGRSVVLGILEFFLVFCILFATVTVMLWKQAPKQKQTLEPTAILVMDPRGTVHLPKNYGTPTSSALNLTIYFSPGDCPARKDLIDEAFKNCKQHSRFRQTPQFSKTKPWSSCFGYPEITTKETVERHIVDCTPVKTEDELTKELVRIESLPLLENAPAWIIYRIPSKGSCRGCLVIKINHCIGDGLRLAIWAESRMTDMHNSPCDWGLGPIKGEKVSPWSKKRKPVKMSFLSRMKMNFHTVISALQAGDLTDTVTPLHPANSIFKGKRVTFRMKPIPLEEFRLVAKETNSTINDILTTVVASAIRRYCLKFDPSFNGVVNPICRGCIAIGFPCKKGFTQSSEQLFNDFGIIPFDFPIGDMNPKQRLKATKGNLFKLKNTIVAPFVKFIGNMLSKLGCYNLQKEIFTKLTSNLTFIFSNVRGPPERSYYLGKEIIHVECSYANYTSQLIFLSYSGVMGGTFTTDVTCIKDPQLLLDYIHTELMCLADAVLPKEKRYSSITR